MKDDAVCVIMNTYDDVEANLALQFLKENGMIVSLEDEYVNTMLPVAGGIKLIVLKEQAEEAAELLRKWVASGEVERREEMKPEQLEKMLSDAGALLSGHFKLTSGRHSDRYVEKIRLLYRPDLVSAICREFAQRFARLDVDVVIGPAMGGIVLAYELARQTGRNFAFTQRKNGKMELRGGFPIEPDAHALVIEDITTTGGSVQEVLDCLAQRDIIVDGIGIIVDRSGGRIDFDVPVVESLLTLDIQSWEADDCPLCADHKPLTTPGSSDKPV